MTVHDVRVLARRVLDAVLAGDRRPVAVAHPLDFVCIPVLRSPEFGVCGHVWSDGAAAATVHSHSWHLESQVIVGAITNELFSVSTDPDGAHQLLVVDNSGSVDRLTPTRHTVNVEQVQLERHSAGSSYRLLAGVFHRSTPLPEGPTLTLLSATTVLGARNEVVGSAHTSEVRSTLRRELSAVAALDLVAMLRSAL